MDNEYKYKFASVILAAGKGTRMRSNLPKVMHQLAGKSMIAHVIEALKPLSPAKTVVVVAPGMDEVKQAALKESPGCQFAMQEKQLGTGDAVRSADATIAGFNDTVLVLYGDTPLITAETLQKLLEASRSAELVVLGMRPADPADYGRLIVDGTGQLEEIVEAKDATPEQRQNALCNSGVMAISGKHLFSLLRKLEPHNKAGEYYLTDIAALADSQNLHCRILEADAGELMGINSRAQLAQAERVLQQRLRRKAMDEGATLLDPDSTYFSTDTRLGQDVVVHPQVVFKAGVVVEDDVEIRSFSHLEGAYVKKGAIIGPFARLRPGSVIGEGAHVGNFVELKKASLGKGAKANHLSYVGDAEVGDGANIGAGTITCNYDGVDKHKTVIGKDAFIGSNTSLVAPVTVGDGAIVGAGSVITKDVEAGALAIERGAQTNKPAKATEIRQRKRRKA